MSYSFIGFPPNIIKYLNPPTGDYGLVNQLTISSFGEDIEVKEDYKNTYPLGKGIQTIDFGSL